MKIVIIGAGEIGAYLTELLIGEKHDVIIIEKNGERVDAARERFDAQVIHGDGSNALILEPIIDEATSILIAVTDNDSTNIIATLIARRFGVQRAISRVSDSANLIHPLLTDDPKVSVLNAEMIISKDLARMVGNPHADDVDFFARGKAEMLRLHVIEDSEVAYKKLKDLKIPPSWLCIARIRLGKFSIAAGDTELRPGDQVLLVGDPKKAKEIEAFMGLRPVKVRRVILIGFNEISSKLALALTRRGIEVRMIEENPAQAEAASGILNKVLVLQGDGTSEEILEQAGIDQTDYLLALTDDDETNVLISLLAKEQKVNRVIALASKRQYKPVIEKIGVDSVLNPRAAMVDEIIRCIHHEDLSGISILEGGEGRMVEVVVKKKTKFVDIPLSRIKLPKGTLVGAIVRNDELIIPRGDSRVHIGDHILIFTAHSALTDVKRMFT